MNKLLDLLTSGQTLSKEQARELLLSVLPDSLEEVSLSETEIREFLLASSKRLPTAAELSGSALALRERARHLELEPELTQGVLLDTCGTGGSGLDSFNTSTAVALLLASSGVKVVKHGNRALSGKCGSADLLEALGVKLEAEDSELLRSLHEKNFCFLFAPSFHPATKRVQQIRRELGVRTIFNFLGPLSNPLRPTHQLIGVSAEGMLETYARALRDLGCKAALIVRGQDGLDEISLSSSTEVCELRENELSFYQIEPEQFNLARAEPSELSSGSKEESKAALLSILQGEDSAKARLVALNAAAAFYLCGKAENWSEGLELAKEALKSGSALRLIIPC